MRDAAYESLLRSRRQQLHARIAAVLEERFPEAAATEPELLARHCAGAGLAERAVAYWQQAAELAVGRSANLEAIAHCERRKRSSGGLPPSPERSRAELEIQLAKGIAVRAGKGYAAPEAERVFLRAGELCEELGDRVRLVHALRGLLGVLLRRGAVAGRGPRSRTGSRRRPRDSRTAASALRGYVEGATRLFSGEPRRRCERFEAGLRHYDEGDRDTHFRLSGLDTASADPLPLGSPSGWSGLPEQRPARARKPRGSGAGWRTPSALAQRSTSRHPASDPLARDWYAAESIAACR